MNGQMWVNCKGNVSHNVFHCAVWSCNTCLSANANRLRWRQKKRHLCQRFLRWRRYVTGTDLQKRNRTSARLMGLWSHHGLIMLSPPAVPRLLLKSSAKVHDKTINPISSSVRMLSMEGQSCAGSTVPCPGSRYSILPLRYLQTTQSAWKNMLRHSG